MKKQINDLLFKMQSGENDIGETANRILDELGDNKVISAFALNTGRKIEKLILDQTDNLENRNRIREAYILQWYTKTKDENFADFFSIKRIRNGDLETETNPLQRKEATPKEKSNEMVNSFQKSYKLDEVTSVNIMIEKVRFMLIYNPISTTPTNDKIAYHKYWEDVIKELYARLPF